MKKLVLIALSCLMLGCGNTRQHQAIVEQMNTTEVVVAAPGKEYTFIVRTTDNAVWLVEMYGNDPKTITAKVNLFAAR